MPLRSGCHPEAAASAHRPAVPAHRPRRARPRSAHRAMIVRPDGAVSAPLRRTIMARRASLLAGSRR